MSDAYNQNVDFNIALQTGQLDEAAKIQNDMNAQAQEWALTDAAAKSQTASQRRQDQLNKQKADLTKQRDNRLKALDQEYNDEKKHLQRVQQMRDDALKKQEQSAIASYQKEWDARKANLDAQLELFKAFVPKNEAQLQSWMKDVGITYKNFGDNTLNPMSQEWGKFFQKSFQAHVREAGANIASSHMWETAGNKMAKHILLGMGFNSMAKFKQFVITGKLPADFGQPKKRNPQGSGSNTTVTPHHHMGQPGGMEIHHAGGVVGDGSRNRGGIMGGMHPSEQMVLAQRGERILDVKTSKRYAKQLDLMDKGIYGGSGDIPGMGGLVSAITGRMFGTGVANALGVAVQKVKNSIGTGLGSGISGTAYVPGAGGRHRPISGRYPAGPIHDQWTGYPAVDFAAPVGQPVYAVADGIISRSYDLRGYEPRRPGAQDGFRSYGRVMYLQTNAGPEVLYAHLSKRGLSAGTRVKGGSVIGLSGDTGYATGPHLHFGSRGASPLAWLETGGHTLNDGLAMLHEGETVLTKPLSESLSRVVNALDRASQGIPTRSNKNTPNIGHTVAANNVSSGGDAWTWVSNMIRSAKATADLANNAATTLRTGTYNLKFSTKNSSSEADLLRLMGKADTLGLTEFVGHKRAMEPWIRKHGWGVTQGHGKDDTAILWNAAKYKLLASSQQLLNSKVGVGLNPNRPGGARRQFATVAHLQDRRTGRSFWEVVAHTIAHLWKSPRNREVQTQQYEALNHIYKNLSSTGQPVFVMGDFNASAGDKALNKIGMIDNWKKSNMTGDYTFGHEYIDHVMYDKLSRLIGQQIMHGSSDHNALLTQFNIPSLSKGAMNVKWDNTLANLHAGESVLTADYNKKFRDGMENFASGGGNTYTIHVYGDGANADEIADKVLHRIKREEARKPRSRAVRKGN